MRILVLVLIVLLIFGVLDWALHRFDWRAVERQAMLDEQLRVAEQYRLPTCTTGAAYDDCEP